MIKVKRVYDKADITDGDRILVDRLWPRGIRRSTPNIDVWIKDVAPSDELRKWFAHDPAKWKAFKEKYKKELSSNKALDKLIEYINSKDTVTFLYSTKDTEHNNAQVLLEVVNERLKKEGKDIS
ncbi:MAG: DUF488 domain-containing protein [Candidatus Marsarchaeota archaeon]|jgi:uncharacterized protein YeaO (DUF488 family)|nr:DUF488 domain-containing protein [Candidatus Marsarchaeota archaeon]